MDESLVCKLLEKMPTRKASPDIPLVQYKAASPFLAPLLTQRLKETIVQDLWKTAAVTWIPKSHTPSSEEDIRPLSLLTPSEKPLERIIVSFATKHFILRT